MVDQILRNFSRIITSAQVARQRDSGSCLGRVGKQVQVQKNLQLQKIIEEQKFQIDRILIERASSPTLMPQKTYYGHTQANQSMASNSVFNQIVEGVTGPAELYDTQRFQTMNRRSVGQEGSANTPDAHEFKSPGKRPTSPFRHQTESIKSATGIPKISALLGSADVQQMSTRARQLSSSIRLFHQFFIIGATFVHIHEEEYVTEPRVISQFPNLPMSEQCARRSQVKDFCFPSGIRIKRLPLQDALPLLYNILYQSVSPRECSYYFTLDARVGDANNEFDDQKEIICLCYSSIQVLLMRDDYVWIGPRAYVLMFQNEFFPLHNDLLLGLIRIHRYKRLLISSSLNEVLFSSQVLRDIEAQLMAPAMHQDMARLLFDYFMMPSLIPGKSITFTPSNEVGRLDYVIPIGEQMRFASRDWFCPLFFSSLSLESFYSVLIHVLLENSVIFVSKDLRLLSAAAMALTQILRPLHWCLSKVPLIPASLRDVLDAPFPLIAGIHIDKSLTTSDWVVQRQNTLFVYLDQTTQGREIIKAGMKCWFGGKRDSSNITSVAHPDIAQARQLPEPELNSLKAGLAPLYSKLFSIEKIEKSKRQIAGSYSNSKKNLCLNPRDSDVKNAREICQKIERAISGVLSVLPRKRRDKEGVNLKQVAEDFIAYASSSLGGEYAKLFASTQMFMFYLEQYYLN